MDIIKIVCVAIIGSVLCVVIKNLKPEFLPFLQISCILVVFTLSFDGIKNLLNSVFDFISGNNVITGEYIIILLKVLGVALITKIGTEICKDSGNLSLSTIIELAGKIIILSFCFPLFKIVVLFADGMLK